MAYFLETAYRLYKCYTSSAIRTANCRFGEFIILIFYGQSVVISNLYTLFRLSLRPYLRNERTKARRLTIGLLSYQYEDLRSSLCPAILCFPGKWTKFRDIFGIQLRSLDFWIA